MYRLATTRPACARSPEAINSGIRDGGCWQSPSMTTIHWELEQRGDYTIVLFKHEGWREPGEFMHHCSTKWAIYLMSLKQLVETGEGAPSPRDVPISDWH